MLRIINKESQAIIREDIDKINQIFNNRYEIIDLSNTPEWKKFKERFYRRNLIIHHMSYVDDTYRIKTGYDGNEHQLNIDDKYLAESLSLFARYAHILYHAFEDKFMPIIQKRYATTKP